MDIPQVIANRFRIECEIGRGGMGTVYRATHLGLERTVAVKVLKKDVAADPEVAERFMREARTMAKLRHPRAAMIFDAGKLPDGRPFIVMEHVEGSTLAEVLGRDGRFAPERAVRVASEICDVLTEAHRLGIVHRDLKPSNIMLNERGVSVLDFGIAKVLANSADATRTHATTESGLIIGTPRYMSPEQCTGQPVGPASDLYSLGVLLYEMLAGQPPFTDQLQSAVLVKQATLPPPPLVSRRPDVPRRLALVVHALLAKSTAERPKSAREARLDLERAVTIPEYLPPDETTATSPFASTLAALDARSTLAARAVTALTVLAVMGGAMFVWSLSSASWRADASTAMTDAAGATTKPVRFAARDAALSVPVSQTNDPAVPAPASAPAASLSPTAARQIAASLITRGTVTEARALRTDEGTLIAAVEEDRAAGTSRLILLAPRGLLGGFRIAGRVTLDKEDFSGAKWTTETVDADGDGYDEIVCTGFDASNDSFSRRLVLYSPRERESFSMRAGADARESGAVRVKWSMNAGGERARPFRKALRERALADLPGFKS
ncbi:MAG: serine/threonine-protein kinase [Pyrinomonadaceae bacterium]